MRKIVLAFGFIAGLILSVMMVVTMVVNPGFDAGAIIGYTTMVVAFLMIFFGVRSYRDNIAGGVLSFGRALQMGLLIAALASVCYVASWEVLYFAVWPDFGDRYAAHLVDHARAGGATPAEIVEVQRQADHFKAMYRNPVTNVALTFLEPLPVGVLIALVSAGVLRRKTAGATAA